MAISTLISTAQEKPTTGGHKPYVRKATRDENPHGPPELGLRPSRYRLAERLYAHFAKVRNDREYQREYEAYETEELRKRLVSDDAWAAKRAANKDRPRKVYAPRVRASELKDCARGVAMRLMEFPAAPTGEGNPHWNIAGVSGSAIHERIQIALTFLKVSDQSEFSVYSADSTFSGRVDHRLSPSAFPELGDAALPAICDVKTVGSDDFAKGYWGDKVEGYLKQVSPYCRLTGCPVGVILLVDRGSGKLLDFEFDADADHGDKMLRRAAMIAGLAERRQLPKPESKERGETFACFNFCGHREMCEAEIRNGEVQTLLGQGVSPSEIYARLHRGGG